jgi:hypothetical protein
VATAPTSSEAFDIEVAILLVVFKAVYNICADDAMPGEPLGGGSGGSGRLSAAVSEEEATTLEAVLEHVRSSEDFMSASEELAELSGRLLGQLLIIIRKFEAGHLVPI